MDDGITFLEALLEDETYLRTLTGMTVDDAHDVFDKFCGEITPIRRMYQFVWFDFETHLLQRRFARGFLLSSPI